MNISNIRTSSRILSLGLILCILQVSNIFAENIEVNQNNQNNINAPKYWSPIKISLYGKLSLPYNLNCVSPLDIGCIGTMTKNVYGIQTSGLYTKADNIYGIQCSAGRNIITNKLIGIQVSGFCSDEGIIFDNVVQKNEIYGAQISGLYSKGHNFSGIQTTGLFSKIDNFNGAQISGLSSDAKNFNGLNISGLYSKSNIFYGLGISGLLNTNRFHGIGIGASGNGAYEIFSGMQISSLFSVCGEYKFDYDLCFVKQKNNDVKIAAGTVYGLQVAGLISKSENMHGIEIGGLVSDCNKEFCGISIGGLSSYAGQGLGLCVSSIYSANYYGKFQGLLASGIMTYSEYLKGLQFSFINSASNVAGLQIGVINYVSCNLTGSQVGIFNEAENVCGAQIGVLNYCRTLKGIQIGFLNHLGNPGMLKIKIVPLINFCF
jgi:hypothetical protein